MKKEKKNKKQKNFEVNNFRKKIFKSNGKSGKKSKTNKESELEEEIKDVKKTEKKDKTTDKQFQNFLEPSVENFSPVLEKAVNILQQDSLEQEFIHVSDFSKNQDDKQTGYIAQNIQKNYTLAQKRTRNTEENFFVEQPELINIENIRRETVGRNLHPHLKEISPVDSKYFLIENKKNYGIKIIQPEKQDVEKIVGESQERSNEKIKEYKIR